MPGWGEERDTEGDVDQFTLVGGTTDARQARYMYAGKFITTTTNLGFCDSENSCNVCAENMGVVLVPLRDEERKTRERHKREASGCTSLLAHAKRQSSNKRAHRITSVVEQLAQCR